MNQHTVVLVPLDNYEQKNVDAAVEKGLSLLGGVESIIGKDEKVLLKPNLLGKALPQKAITTHFSVFSAVCKVLKEKGYAHVSYGDSPGSPTTTPEKAAEACGIAAEARKWGVPAGEFNSGSVVHFPEGAACKSFYLCKAVQETDALVNICKMKTHALERITGAVKNMYGCITGVNKATGHAHFPSSETFADMLADLNRCVKPRLHIMDGVVAMEGNGPSSGTPVAMNVLLFSLDPVALDSVFAGLIHLDPHQVPTCESSERAGLGTMDYEKIAILTPDGTLTMEQAREKYGNDQFDVYRGVMKKNLLAKFMPLLPFLQHRPRVDMKKCIACGVCEESCPVPEKAVHAGNGRKAKYDYKKCIRCYCCQEMCPAKAIEVYRSPWNKLLGGK